MVRRTAAALSLAVVTPLGFYSKFYRGPAQAWVNDSLGGVLYVILWCLVAVLLVPQWRPAPVVLSVLAATCFLEFLQLWHPPFLQWARSHFLGRTILGDFFDWTDFPHYVAGAAFGYLWLKFLRVSASPRQNNAL